MLMLMDQMKTTRSDFVAWQVSLSGSKSRRVHKFFIGWPESQRLLDPRHLADLRVQYQMVGFCPL